MFFLCSLKRSTKQIKISGLFIFVILMAVVKKCLHSFLRWTKKVKLNLLHLCSIHRWLVSHEERNPPEINHCEKNQHVKSLQEIEKSGKRTCFLKSLICAPLKPVPRCISSVCGESSCKFVKKKNKDHLEIVSYFLRQNDLELRFLDVFIV